MNSLMFAFFSAIFLIGCASSGQKSKASYGESPVYYAVAVVRPLQDSKVEGKVLFAEAFGKVKMQVELSGLDIKSKHGFHIHEFGDCTAVDGSSAGGHYNPEGAPHGGFDSEYRHAGDFGNIITDSKGRAKLTLDIPGISINGTTHPILGRAVVVHKDYDDLISQPTGGSGERIGCGVIGAAAK